MNQFDVVQGFLECGETASSSPDQLAAEFLEAMQALGFPDFGCRSHPEPFHPPPEALTLHNYPRECARTYSDRVIAPTHIPIPISPAQTPTQPRRIDPGRHAWGQQSDEPSLLSTLRC